MKQEVEWLAAQVWCLRYAMELRRLLKLTWRECWQFGQSTLHDIKYDLDEDPKDWAQEEYDVWRNG